jgi:hypothetical protein
MVERRLEVAQVDGVRVLGDLFADGRVDRRAPLDYFFSRLVPRPRDAIQFLVSCLEEAQRRDEGHISADALVAAEMDYSAWRRDVILEEARYGGLPSAVGVLDSLGSGPRTFTPRELRRRLDETKKEYNISETKPQIINALVEWGALGVQHPSGQTEFIWDGPDGTQPSPSEGDEEDEQQSYIVHPSLWSALALRAPRARLDGSLHKRPGAAAPLRTSPSSHRRMIPGRRMPYMPEEIEEHIDRAVAPHFQSASVSKSVSDRPGPSDG